MVGEPSDGGGQVGEVDGECAGLEVSQQIVDAPRHRRRGGANRGGYRLGVELVQTRQRSGHVGGQRPQEPRYSSYRGETIEPVERRAAVDEVHQHPRPVRGIHTAGTDPRSGIALLGHQPLHRELFRTHGAVGRDPKHELCRHAGGLVGQFEAEHRGPEATRQRYGIARQMCTRPRSCDESGNIIDIYRHGIYRNGNSGYCRGVSATEPPTPSDDHGAAGPDSHAWRIDQLAALVDLPVRTIREYQTMGLLPPPRRDGRVGLYGHAHLHRLQLITRLQDRGYSLAGIADLLGQWRAGADLADVLGLDADQLVHIDEPGRPATLHQLIAVLPTLVPDRLDALVAAGVVERCGPDRYCVPSPSLLQLTADAVAAGVDTGHILSLLAAVRDAADTVAAGTLDLLGGFPADVDPAAVATLLQRGRGLLAHGIGRLTIHTIGHHLGVDTDDDLSTALERIARTQP